MEGCLFCQIVKKEIPCKILYEDDHSMAFEDINPQAPVHLLIIPKHHIQSLAQTSEADSQLMGQLLHTLNHVAKEKGIKDSGYRTVINTGDNGGQTVHHLHMHLLGGRFMTWPPG